MSRQYKIKRYHKHGNTYRAKPHPLMVIAGIILVAGFVYLGISIYEPVSDFILKNRLIRDNIDISSSLPDLESQEEPAVAEPPKKAEPSALRTVYLPTATAVGAETLDAFLATLDGTEINAVMVDIKNAAGSVLFNTTNQSAKDWGAVVEAPLDLKALEAKLEAKNLALVVRMSAFRDPVAASVGRENAIAYRDTEWLWLDNTAEAGGKPWLNPYATGSRQYITDLAVEAVDAGAKLVVLENCQFPAGSEANASFGPAAAGISRSQVLRDFVGTLETKLEEKDARVAVYLTVTSINQEYENTTRYGGSPLDAAGANIVLGALPYQYGGDYAVEGLTITSPVENPGPAVEAAIRYVMQARPAEAEGAIIPLIQGGNDITVNTAPYTKAQVDAQIAAVTATGLTEYILYVTDGVYSLS